MILVDDLPLLRKKTGKIWEFTDQKQVATVYITIVQKHPKWDVAIKEYEPEPVFNFTRLTTNKPHIQRSKLDELIERDLGND